MDYQQEMSYGESNGHVTLKSQGHNPIWFEFSKVAGNRESFTLEHLQEMAHGESYGHMPDDVT